MSYILEALKKSEHERKQGHVPNLQTVHVPVAPAHNHSSWPYVIIVLLLLCLLLVLGWMGFQDRGAVSEPVPADPVDSVVPPIVNRQAPSKEPVLAETLPAINKETLDADPVLTGRSSGPQNNNDNIPDLVELPSLIQQAIPQLNFAGHVYSSNPLQRSVIINGASMSEGDRVIDGLILREINQKGVVLSYRGQLFRMQVLQDWSFD